MQRVNCDPAVPTVTREPRVQAWCAVSRVISGELDGRTAFGQSTNSAMPIATAYRRAQQGGQYVG